MKFRLAALLLACLAQTPADLPAFDVASFAWLKTLDPSYFRPVRALAICGMRQVVRQKSLTDQ
jgi:hypothetical protein